LGGYFGGFRRFGGLFFGKVDGLAGGGDVGGDFVEE
jgi:hypothetical protein